MDDAGSAIARVVTLPGRGSTVVWDCPGPLGAHTLVLLHGVTLTAELNWSAVFPVLGRHFRVLAFDQRGHGSGLGCVGGYRLEQCADDVAELAAILDVARFIGSLFDGRADRAAVLASASGADRRAGVVRERSPAWRGHAG